MIRAVCFTILAFYSLAAAGAPPAASVLLTVCSATGLGVGEVMNYAKWFIVSMIVTLMIVSFMPWTALLFL